TELLKGLRSGVLAGLDLGLRLEDQVDGIHSIEAVGRSGCRRIRPVTQEGVEGTAASDDSIDGAKAETGRERPAARRLAETGTRDPGPDPKVAALHTIGVAVEDWVAVRMAGQTTYGGAMVQTLMASDEEEQAGGTSMAGAGNLEQRSRKEMLGDGKLEGKVVSQ
ncbi:hypothetical protein S83_041842, partial [Arachis hypogaea]